MVFKKRVRERKRCSISLYMRTPYKSHSSTCDEPDTQICVYTSVGVVYTNWCFVYTQKCQDQWTLEYGVPPGGSHQRGSAMAEDQESAPLHAADIKGTVEMPPALRPPTLASGQMSRDGSVAAAAGARRGDGQTVPVPRGRLAASIGCVSHHRMVWGPPHRARTPALRPPTRARGQMSRCSDRSVAAAGARRGDGQTAPASGGGGSGGAQTMLRWATHVRRPHGDASGPSAVPYRKGKKSHYPFNCGGAYSQEWKSAYTQGDACVYAKCCVYTPRAHFVSAAFWPCVYALAIGVSTTSSCPRLAYAFGTQFCVCVYACLPLRVQRGRGCVYTQGDACVYTRCVYTQGDALCIHEALCVYTTGAHICACGGLV